MSDAAEIINHEFDPVLTAFKPYEGFCKSMLDAYVVVDRDGRVLKCNALVGQLVGMRTKQILKAESLDQLLSLNVGERVVRISELAKHISATRVDEVTGAATEGHIALNLIIGVYPFLDAKGNSIGAFMLLRDVTAETKLQDKYKDKATQSITDALTGLFNRAYFTDYMKSQLSTLESFPESAPQRTMSVVMMDIDFFKKINDVYGHQAGDTVLTQTAELLKKSFRKTDMVARYGGEEFLAILPGTDIDGAAIAANKLRAMVAGNKFVFGTGTIPVTISMGVAQIQLGIETGDQAIARADAALYHSKENGRNLVSIHDRVKAKELKRDI